MKLSVATTLFGIALPFVLGDTVLADPASEARKAIEELFGERLAATAKTASPADDIELFEEIIPITGTIKDRPAVFEVACLLAVERLGKKPGGHDAAIRALNTLIKKQPKKWETYLHKIIEVREHQSKFGERRQRGSAAAAHVTCLLQLATIQFDKDDAEAGLEHVRDALLIAKRYRLKSAKAINGILEELNHIERQLREIAQLKNRLKSNPDDTATAKKLVWIYLLERNDAEEARKYAFLLNDEAFVETVKLATKPMKDIDEADALKLTDWYESISNDTGVDTKQKMQALNQAIRYTERYLDLHAAIDLPRVKAEIRLRKLKQAAAKTTAGPSPPPPRRPSLPGR